MKNSFKINITLLILGCLLVFSSAYVNLNEPNKVNTISKNEESYSKTPDAKPLSSGFWTVSFIHVNKNWSASCEYIQYHAGTLEDPHIIENVTIDATNSPTYMGILIVSNDNDYFIIRNCTIINAAYGGYSICLVDTMLGKIENNTCSSNNGFGFGLFNSLNNTIIDNEINNNGQGGIYFSTGSNNNTIINNTISNNNFDGIWFESCGNNTIRGNTIKNNGFNGIMTKYSNNNTIYKNNIYDNDWDGIRLEQSNNNTIYENTIYDNTWDGIRTVNSDNNTIYENTIYSNGWDGIMLDLSDYNTIYENTISNHDYGVWLFYSSYNRVFNNTFVSNNICIVEDGTCIDNILTPNTCIPKGIAPSDDDDDDDDGGNGALKIPGYDLFLISTTILLITGILSLFWLKKKNDK